MIISHPILGAIKDMDFSFAALVKNTGTYPVTPSQMWHGGTHLEVNAPRTDQVRAIADGTVIAYRLPTVKPTVSWGITKCTSPHRSASPLPWLSTL